jgi:hypothetical protein
VDRMSRFRKGEYGTEKRGRPADRPDPPPVCQGGMGMCRKKTGLSRCPKCAKPYCAEHLGDHRGRCLGWG